MKSGLDDETASTRMRGFFDPKRGHCKAYNHEPNLIEGTNLLATCSEIYQAARGVLYGYNDFEFRQSDDLISFLESMNKDTAAYIKCLNMGWLLPGDFKLAAKLLAKCTNLQKLHINLDEVDLPGPPYNFRTEQEPQRVVPPFKAVLKQIYYNNNNNNNNKVGFFARVTWTSPFPTRNLTKEQKVESRAFNKKMKDLILAQVMPPVKTPANSKVSGKKRRVARKSTHVSSRESA